MNQQSLEYFVQHYGKAYCYLCGDTYVANEVAPYGHTVGAEATCTTAQICTVCEVTIVEKLGHDWEKATTESPKTCKTCGETEGEKLPGTENSDNNKENWFAILWRAISEFFVLLFGFLRKGVN